MKGYERRAAGKPNFWKLAVWSELNQCWLDGGRQYDTPEAAKADARKPGHYRLSFAEDGKGRTDKGEFVI